MNDPSHNSIVTTLSKKWKLEQIPNKKLEIENKLMEERLNQLKTNIKNDKEKRNVRAEGGSIWSKGQAGLVTTYAKNVENPDSINNKNSILNKPSNRAIKLKVLKDEAIVLKQQEGKSSSGKDKKHKCGQCEKNLAFTRCLECGEDYCAKCFTEFHMKGALQKHRTTSIPLAGTQSAPKPQTKPNPPMLDERLAYQNYQMHQNNQQKKEPESLSRHESFGIFDNEDEDFMNTIQENNDPYSDNNNSYNNNNQQGGGSLLHGTYDEQAAGDSFQQALNDWRNQSQGTIKTKTPRSQPTPKKQTKSVKIANTGSETHRTDANIGTDASMQNNDDAFKELKNQIESNHSLSCAERMLLLKLRREDKENNGGVSSRSIASNKNYLIEEIPNQSTNFPKTSLDLKNLEPELIEVDKAQLAIETRREEIQRQLRPKSSVSRPGTSRPLSSRVSTARPGSSMRKSIKDFESNICRVPSATLQRITNREMNLEEIYKEESGVGEFLLLDVTKRNDENEGPKTDRQKEAFKLSHKFYEMSPRSWQPNNSIVPTENEPTKPLSSRPMNAPQIPSRAMEAYAPNQNTNSPRRSVKTPEVKSSRQSVSRSSNVKTPVNTNLAKSFQRNKTFMNVSDIRKTSTTPRSSRVKSAAGGFAPSNPINMEVAKSFLEFDIDDGRSSKLCQNEDDKDYYGQLEVEYKTNLHRTSNVFDQKDNFVDSTKVSRKENQAVLKNLSENVMASLELNLRDEDYEDDYNDVDMDIEELKSLR